MDDAYQTGPAFVNVPAEQALLGALLINNDVLDAVGDTLKPEHFGEPLHGLIYRVAADRIAGGEVATPVTLRHAAEAMSGIDQVGGPAYLARLAAAAVSVFNCRDYAREIVRDFRRRRLADALDEARREVATADDPAAVALGLESRLVALAEDAKDEALVVSWVRALKSAVDEVSDAYQNEGAPAGAVSTGLPYLDGLIGGLFPGELTILGGRPSMGKSAIAGSLALAAARAGKGVLFASLEMRPSGVALRAMSEHLARQGVRIPYRDARLGRLSEDQMRRFVMGALELEPLPILMTPPYIRSIETLQAATRRAARMFERMGSPLGLIVFDYLQLADSGGKDALERITAISKALKAVALRHNVPMLALSQLSRQCEQRDDKRPMLSDLRDSGSIEQDADVVLFCYRDEYYLERQKPRPSAKNYDAEILQWSSAMDAARGKVEIIVAKQRMGEAGSVVVPCDLATNAIGIGPVIEGTAQEAFI